MTSLHPSDRRYAALNEAVRKASGWTLARQAILLALAIMAFLQNYFFDLMIEIASMPSISAATALLGG